MMDQPSRVGPPDPSPGQPPTAPDDGRRTGRTDDVDPCLLLDQELLMTRGPQAALMGDAAGLTGTVWLPTRISKWIDDPGCLCYSSTDPALHRFSACPESAGIGVRIRPDSVSGFARNRCPDSVRLDVRIGRNAHSVASTWLDAFPERLRTDAPGGHTGPL